ncbi:TIGR04282 family arsenosugar biosynthesis glycosyltransferase [Hugonella massiliensis]|uniref:TIGR04282 family arsenosugar biosynthesis glycosyltransferase n=1 Tax=Hugonella massiliensis TaxID=1720315 RepID=UPI00073FA53D|nr:TIGR04282 family arsenosugar biosynthesis glycosyltransferase [Hugonella massiliensis]
MTDRPVIVLFTRVPVAGAVKTRLAPALSPDDRARLQWEMACDCARHIACVPADLAVHYGDEWRRAPEGAPLRVSFLPLSLLPLFLSLSPPFSSSFFSPCPSSPSPSPDAYAGRDAGGFRAREQRGAGLGARMKDSLAYELGRGAGTCLLMGSDLPEVRPADLVAALDAARSADVVLGPSTDGGYWLVGLHEPFPQLFDRKSYGSASVLQEALATCAAHGRRVALAPTRDDVDTPSDLARIERLPAYRAFSPAPAPPHSA